MDRKRKRIYNKERSSQKYLAAEILFQKELKTAKSDFYEKMISILKLSKPSQWYSNIKRITSYDQQKSDKLIIDEISHLSYQEQVEIIADKFASIQNEYQPLQKEDISVPTFSSKDIPKFHPSQV